jgi:Fe-S cluster assembly protein SufD
MQHTFTESFHFDLSAGGKESLELVFEKRAKGDIYLHLNEDAKEIELYLHALAGSDAVIFIQNESKEAFSLKVHAKVDRDAKLVCGLLDLSQAAIDLDVQGDLLEQGAAMDFYTGQLCTKGLRKKGKLQITSKVPHTFGNIHNFAVCFDEGFYEMVAAGRIDKGAFGSESHQQTRVLTMGEQHKVLAIPTLYIDENDVKASHALTVGQPDANQLYYLQSRGLSTRQAVGLLAIGYFKPVIDLVADEEKRQQLYLSMEEKVGLYEHS